MADKKISQLTALSAANVASATDVLAIVDTSATETKKITAKDLIDGALNGGTANGVLYLNGSKVATSGSALTFDGTNLGIGTTSPATKLHVYSGSGATSLKVQRTTVPTYLTDCATGASNAASVWSVNIQNTSNGSSSWASPDNSVYPCAAVTLDAPTAGSNILFSTASAVNTAPTERARIDSSGNLLLGGTSTAQLDGVFGQLIGSSTKSTAGIALETQYGAYMLYTDSDDSLIFYDSGDNAPRAKITNGGNFYVGTTTGSYRIQSAVASGADQDMFLSGVTGVTNGVYWKWVNSTSKINVYFSALPTTASAANAYIDNAAGDQLLRSTSSIRYKKDIEDIDHEFADAALNLRPVWYRSKADSDNKDWSWYGLIAEEVAEVEPRLVHWAYPEDAFDVETVDGSIKKTVKEGAKRVPDGVQYERLSVLLLDIVKRQNARIESLEAKVAALEAK